MTVLWTSSSRKVAPIIPLITLTIIRSDEETRCSNMGQHFLVDTPMLASHIKHTVAFGPVSFPAVIVRIYTYGKTEINRIKMVIQYYEIRLSIRKRKTVGRNFWSFWKLFHAFEAWSVFYRVRDQNFGATIYDSQSGSLKSKGVRFSFETVLLFRDHFSTTKYDCSFGKVKPNDGTLSNLWFSILLSNFWYLKYLFQPGTWPNLSENVQGSDNTHLRMKFWFDA